MAGSTAVLCSAMILLPTLLPWLVLLGSLPLLLRRAPRLATFPDLKSESAPMVSIIVPARDEASHIGACIATLLATGYPAREIIVVDDGSGDGTGDIAGALAERTKETVQVVRGSPLPPGWTGKPWACWQGYNEARGELLLFTDAATRHDSDLLGRAVSALQRTESDMVSALPVHPLHGFWSRVILPHLWMALRWRYPSAGRVNRSRSPGGVHVAGEFMLVRRSVYEEVGGHEAVRGEVLSDLRLAQRLVESGHRMLLAHAEDLLDGRAYDSLASVVNGWSKMISAGARSDTDPWLRPWVPAAVVLLLLVLWVLPAAALVAGLLTSPAPVSLWWAGSATALSLTFWLGVYSWMGQPRGHAALYPVGALAAIWVFVRAALWGDEVEWKGRRYRTSPSLGD